MLLQNTSPPHLTITLLRPVSQQFLSLSISSWMIKGKFQDLIKGENSLRKKEQASEPDSDKADLLEL